MFSYACMYMSVYTSNQTQRSRQAVQLSISDLRRQVTGGSGCKSHTNRKITVAVSLLALGIMVVGLRRYFFRWISAKAVKMVKQ